MSPVGYSCAGGAESVRRHLPLVGMGVIEDRDLCSASISSAVWLDPVEGGTPATYGLCSVWPQGSTPTLPKAPTHSEVGSPNINEGYLLTFYTWEAQTAKSYTKTI